MPNYKNVNGQLIELSAEEQAARDAEEQAWSDGADTRAAVQVREERDVKLAACDWRASSDVTMSSAWRDYRQALRDVPAQLPGAVTWPSEPT